MNIKCHFYHSNSQEESFEGFAWNIQVYYEHGKFQPYLVDGLVQERKVNLTHLPNQ